MELVRIIRVKLSIAEFKPVELRLVEMRLVEIRLVETSLVEMRLVEMRIVENRLVGFRLVEFRIAEDKSSEAAGRSTVQVTRKLYGRNRGIYESVAKWSQEILQLRCRWNRTDCTRQLSQ